MNSKDTAFIALRPQLSTEPTENPAEQFQNQVLRPILKFQHERIVAVFQHHVMKRRVPLDGMAPDDRKSYVEKAFQKDLALRNQLIGLVLGLMTTDEWATFISQEKELSRRLHDLLIQRLQSTLG
ncbi:glyoxalase [Salmonirosea aquatica]|uniref:Glyoxalase n=1 Tax=Salmonirosea aquatica TaxID=2654236 RepID=A0A7C9FZN0_9BACT|nr:glyoxalase [Cytophagaceae bacterium SJW1-29]